MEDELDGATGADRVDAGNVTVAAAGAAVVEDVETGAVAGGRRLPILAGRSDDGGSLEGRYRAPF